MSEQPLLNLSPQTVQSLQAPTLSDTDSDPPPRSRLSTIQITPPSLPIILPFGTFYFFWSCVLFLILTYSVVETPYTVAFVSEKSLYGITFVISLIIDAMLTFDICLNFRLAYVDKYDRLRVINDPQLIVKHYLKSWFIFDVIVAFPFSLVLLAASSEHYVLMFRLLRLIKLIRLIRVLEMFNVFHERTLKYETRTALKLFKMLLFMLLTAHYFACLWFFIGDWTYSNGDNSWIDTMVEIEGNSFDNISTIRRYSYSMYWSIITLFTTGYGDITAHNIFEQWTVMICCVIGSIFFAYFIGMLSSLMNEDRISGHEDQKLEETLLFCSHYNIPTDLTQAIVTHIRYFQQYNFVFAQHEIMDALPPYLQKSVQKHLARTTLYGLDIFKSLSSSIVGQIALKLKSKSINTGRVLFKAGDIGTELYIQRTGKSTLYYNGNSCYHRKIRRGDVCGENVIINRNRLHTVKCDTWSEFYVLHIPDVLEILQSNLEPVEAQKQWEKIKRVVRRTMHSKKTPRKIDILAPKPRFQEFVHPVLHGHDEKSKKNEPEKLQRKLPSLPSLKEMLRRPPSDELSENRDKAVIRMYSRQEAGVMLEIGVEDTVDDGKHDIVNIRNERSESDSDYTESSQSGGFGEQFGIYTEKAVDDPGGTQADVQSQWFIDIVTNKTIDPYTLRKSVKAPYKSTM